MTEQLRTTNELLKYTFERALAAYEPFHTKDHQRINPDDGFDPDQVVIWGRAWYTILTVSNWEGEDLPVLAMATRLRVIGNLDLNEVLELMYG